MSYEFNLPCSYNNWTDSNGVPYLDSSWEGGVIKHSNLALGYCPEPFTGLGCQQTWADHYGASFVIFQIYTGLFGLVTFSWVTWRAVRLYGLKSKFAKSWESQIPLYVLMMICSMDSMLVAIDPWGYRGIMPRGLNTLFADSRIACGYGAAVIVIFQWVGIVSAKGASSALPTYLVVLEYFLIVCLFIANVIFPPLAYAIVPKEIVINGPQDSRISAFQYVINAFVGIFTSVGAIIYAFRIWNVMGGKAAITKYRTSSAAGKSNNQDLDRYLKMQKVINNMMVMNSVLGFAALYSVYLCISRVGGCYIYYGPGDSFGFNIANTLEIVGPFVVLFIIALPGQKSPAAKLKEAVSNASTAMSGKKSGMTSRQVKVVDSNASNLGSSNASSALSSNSKAGKSEVSMMSSSHGGMESTVGDLDIDDPESPPVEDAAVTAAKERKKTYSAVLMN